MDFFQQHIQHVHSEQHQPFSRVQSTSTLVGCVESVDPQVFLCQSAPCLDFFCSRKLIVELPTRMILTVSMGIFASGEIYVKIINKHGSKPGPSFIYFKKLAGPQSPSFSWTHLPLLCSTQGVFSQPTRVVDLCVLSIRKFSLQSDGANECLQILAAFATPDREGLDSETTAQCRRWLKLCSGIGNNSKTRSVSCHQSKPSPDRGWYPWDIILFLNANGLPHYSWKFNCQLQKR